jgi:hypothetical protein
MMYGMVYEMGWDGCDMAYGMVNGMVWEERGWEGNGSINRRWHRRAWELVQGQPHGLFYFAPSCLFPYHTVRGKLGGIK